MIVAVMHQVICVVVLLVLSLTLNAPVAARMAGDGNWGEGLGILVGPVMIFYIVHAPIYYAVRLVRGPALASFAGSKLNYLAALIGLTGILGTLAQRVPATA
ncbi:hypothetical protein [Rhodopseudomonas telluris]|uniref:Uncharacterized protein n=1 Tax=Rhodopseudomonas telluris TaxID=644215 RepID=A0ABV6EYF7_9BRAD